MTSELLNCQGCGATNLESVLDLGYQPLCNEFWAADRARQPQVFYPLGLLYCHSCSLVQLDHVIPTQKTFGDQSTYLTGSSKSLINFYTQLAAELVDRFQLRPGEVVVEIGSNDGTFLKAFKSHGLQVLGIEGASQSSHIASAEAVPTIPQFFGKGISAAIKERLPAGQPIRLIAAMNVLAHTDNINEFLPEVVSLMEEDTVFVSQSHWLVALLRHLEFDTIYHEHLRYYTLGSLTDLFNRHGLHVVDAEVTDFYGGSVRTYATKGRTGQSEGLRAILKEEEQIDIIQSLKDMKQKLLQNKTRLLNLLVELKASGKRTVGIGAPMKASTLLNFYGITPDLLEYIGEVNPLKVGTVVPGVGIPVIHEDAFFERQPDYALLLTWNMAADIIPKYRSRGYKGKFIIPVPQVEVVE